MINFVVGMLLLVMGYFTYGKLVEKILGPDDRTTPAVANNDGVDFVVLPKWKNLLIQLLNIAGVGPVIGVILGIKFGAIVFLIIPLGNIIGGAVHDFVAGFMSMRYNGANLPSLVRKYTGKKFSFCYSIFLSLILLLVVTVFITTPAQLITGVVPGNIFWIAVGVIFVYYIIATIFPVDSIIGKIYPFFGALLLLGTVALLVRLLYLGFNGSVSLVETAGFKANMFNHQSQPILPCLFVTIACGILSGFHATQSPIVARTMKRESEARATFYGMMIVEGLIAMVWAAGGIAIYNQFPEFMSKTPAFVLNKITCNYLGSGLGLITLLSVVILSITSGDTALRSLRLSLAEIFSVSQKNIVKRIIIVLPLVVLVSILLWWSGTNAKSFGILWNYFAWGNQVLAVVTLLCCTSWLARIGKMYFITLLPAVFMTFIVTTFICWTSPVHHGPYGLGMELSAAMLCGALFAVIGGVRAVFHGFELRKLDEKNINK